MHAGIGAGFGPAPSATPAAPLGPLNDESEPWQDKELSGGKSCG